MIIKRFEPFSVAKISGLIYVVMGLIFGAFMTLVSVIGTGIAGGAGPSGKSAIGAIFGMGALIYMPVFYGVLGFISGFLGSVIYNLVASKIGGIEMETE